jgi:hypothetical protein
MRSTRRESSHLAKLGLHRLFGPTPVYFGSLGVNLSQGQIEPLSTIAALPFPPVSFVFIPLYPLAIRYGRGEKITADRLDQRH